MNNTAGNTSYLPQETTLTTKLVTKSQQLATQLTGRADIASRLSHRYEQLLQAEKYCDCSFLVANVTVRCHKLILSAASPVFEAMFYGPIKEVRHEIVIDDISAEIFQALIAYIYAGNLDFEQLTLEETIELYYSAEKYLLTELIQDCLLAVTRKLRFENILPALELSICMNLSGLLDICMSFFTRCCLGDAQYMGYLKANYRHHISKECVKAIIAANKNLLHKQLLWFVYEWCQQECLEMGLQKSDCDVIIDDLELEKTKYTFDGDQLLMAQLPMPQCQTIERTYYKACRPFTIDSDLQNWKFSLKCERFISLHGLVLHSRLMPTTMLQRADSTNEYNENLTIEISTSVVLADNNVVPNAAPLVWRHTISNQATKYNCDLNIRWREGVVLSPDIEYQIKLIWPTQAFGAEYPCSLMSNIVEGIEFRDFYSYFGSLVKGLSYVNLV